MDELIIWTEIKVPMCNAVLSQSILLYWSRYLNRCLVEVPYSLVYESKLIIINIHVSWPPILKVKNSLIISN